MIHKRLVALTLCSLVLATGASKCQHNDSSSKAASDSNASASADTESTRCTNYRIIKAFYAKKNRAVTHLNDQNKFIAAMYGELANVFPNSANDFHELAKLYMSAYNGTISSAAEKRIGPIEERVATNALSKFCPSGYPAG